jgi:hypothetical protein
VIRWLRSLIDRRRGEAQTARYMAEISRHRIRRGIALDKHLEINADTRPSIDEYRRDPKAWKEKHNG